MRITLSRAFASGLVIAAALVVILVGKGRAQAARPANATTLANLQVAFDGESNAHARYVAFAEKARQEGFGEVASLFRAAAQAEEVHAGNHAAVIRKLGGEPVAKIVPARVRTTRENLQTAIRGESDERDSMYPKFVKQAREAGLSDAVETFAFARAAEAEHARLYAENLKNLDERRGPGKTYYVCSVCGFTTDNLSFSQCPSCFNPKDVYVAIS